MEWTLQVLGINSAVPMKGRHPSSQMLDTGRELFMIDCGECTQMQMRAYRVKGSRIGHIFISHLHGDHIFGLPGLITSFNLNRRTSPLNIYGPRGIKAFVESIVETTHLNLDFPLHIAEHPHDVSLEIWQSPSVVVHSIPLLHRVPTTGYRFTERTDRRSIDAEATRKHSVPYQAFAALKDGADWQQHDGLVIPNDVLTAEGRKPLKYAYCSDTAYDRSIIPLVEGANLLYHEATFLDDMREKAQARGHSTALQAAVIARDASVSKLLLGHFSSRYQDLKVFQEEAQMVFQNTQIAIEGQVYPIAH